MEYIYIKIMYIEGFLFIKENVQFNLFDRSIVNFTSRVSSFAYVCTK